MSNYTLRPAATSQAKPLIGLYAESGMGKTYSGLLLACGFANGNMSKVAMIESEAGRGEAFADDPKVGGYLVRPIRNDFAPSEYGKALTEVESAGVKVCIIDSASHEWEGANGVLSQAADNQAAGKKGPIVWQRPKMSHQRDFMLRLMQTPIDLVIVCMRAKYPMKEVVHNGKKEWIRSENLEPKQADDILFEMFVHGWIDAQHRFHGTKYTRDTMRQIFIDNEPISIDTGKRLLAWSIGKTSPPAQTAPSASPSSQMDGAQAGTPSDGTQGDALTPEQAIANISKAVDADTLALAVDVAKTVCRNAPDQLKANMAYRERKAFLKAQQNEMQQ